MAAQLYFTGSPHPRVLYALHRAPHLNAAGATPGRWWAFSFRRRVDPAKLLDFRNKADAGRLAERLPAGLLQAVEADLKARASRAAAAALPPGPDDATRDRDHKETLRMLERQKAKTRKAAAQGLYTEEHAEEVIARLDASAERVRASHAKAKGVRAAAAAAGVDPDAPLTVPGPIEDNFLGIGDRIATGEIPVAGGWEAQR